MCLDIPAGTAIRFEPGIDRPVDLVAVGGEKRIAGLRALPPPDASPAP
jgi:urease subunit beta